MSDTYSVVYRAVADFKSLQKETKDAQLQFKELQKAEDSYNKSSVKGAIASAAAHKAATSELKKETDAFAKAATAALAYAAAVRSAADAEAKLGGGAPGGLPSRPGSRSGVGSSTPSSGVSTNQRRGMSLTVPTKDLAAFSAAARQGTAETDRLDKTLSGVGKSGNTGVGKAADELGKLGNAADAAGQKTEQAGKKVSASDVGAKKASEGFKKFSDGLSGAMGALSAVGQLAGVAGFFSALASFIQPAMGLIASLGGAVVALGSSLGSLAAGAVAIGPAFAAGAAGIAAVVVGVHGVSDALKAYSAVTQATTGNTLANNAAILSSTRNLVAAQDTLSEAKRNQSLAGVGQALAVADAEHSVDLAQQTSVQAQNELTNARKDAIKTLADLRQAVADNALTEEQAQLDLKRARLANITTQAAPAGTPAALIARQQGTLDVKKAEQGLIDVQRQQTQSQLDLAAANAKGVEQNAQVLAAKQAVAAADYAQLRATQDLGRVQVANFEAQRTSSREVASAMRGLVQAQQAATLAATPAAQAQQALDFALSKLSPAAREVVTQIHAMSGAWKQISGQTQQGLFAPILAQMPAINGFLPVLNSLLTKAGAAMGEVFGAGIKMVTSGPFSRDFQSLAISSAGLIKAIGHAALNVIDAFRNLTMSAAPFTQSLADGLLKGSQSFQAFAAQLRSSGKLAAYLVIIRERISEWWQVLKNVVGVFVNIGRAAFPLTQSLTAGVVAMTARWKAFTSVTSTGGEKLRAWFVGMKPVLHEAAQLFSTLAKSVGGTLSNTTNLSTAVTVISKIRTELVPAVKQIIGAFSKFGITSLSGPIVDTLATLAQGVAKLLTEVGKPAFDAFWATIQKAATWLTSLASSVTPNVDLMTKLGTALGTVGAVTAIGKYTGLFALIGKLGSLGPILTALPPGLLKVLGPIGLVAGAIGLLATQSPELRSALTGVFDGLMSALKPLVPVLAGLAHDLVGIFGPVLVGAVKIVSGLVTAVSGLIGWVQKLPGPIKFAADAFLIFATAAVAFGPLRTAIRGFISAMATTVVAAISAATGIKAAFISTGIGAIVVGLTAVIAFLVSKLGTDVPDAAKASQDALGSLSDTLEKNTLAWTKATRAKILDALATKADGASESLLDQLSKAGVSASDAIDAVLGMPNAMAKVASSMSLATQKIAATSDTMNDLNKAAKLAGVTNIITADQVSQAALGNADAIKLITDTTHGWVLAQQNSDKASQDGMQAHQALGEVVNQVAADVAGADTKLGNYTKTFAGLQGVAGVTAEKLAAAGKAQVAVGDAVAYTSGKVQENSKQLYVAYQGWLELNPNGTIDQFVSAMGSLNVTYGEVAGKVQSTTDATAALNAEQAKDPGYTARLGDTNAALEKTITLAEAAKIAIAGANADDLKNAVAPQTAYDLAKAKANPTKDSTTTTTAADVATANETARAAAQAKAEKDASTARDAQGAAIQKEQDATVAAADKIKSARIAQADAEERTAAATVDAVNKRLAAAQREASKATDEVDRLRVLANQAQDQLNNARGDVRSNVEILNDAVKNKQAAKSPKDAAYWDGVIKQATKDEADARKRATSAQGASTAAGQSLTKGTAQSKLADTKVTSTQAQLDAVSKQLADLTGSNTGKRAQTEADYAAAVKNAATVADAARKKSQDTYDAILAQQSAAEAAAQAATAATNKATVADTKATATQVEPTLKQVADAQNQLIKEHAKRVKDLADISKQFGPEIAAQIQALPVAEAGNIVKRLLDPKTAKKDLDSFLAVFSKGTPAAQALEKAAQDTIDSGVAAVPGMTQTIAQGILDGFSNPNASLEEIGKQAGINFSTGLQNGVLTNTVTITVTPVLAPGYGAGTPASVMGATDYHFPTPTPGATTVTLNNNRRKPQNQGGSVGLVGVAGGLVPGVGVSDTVPIDATPGEFVFKKAAVDGLGLDNLKYWNNQFQTGRIGRQKFTLGGEVLGQGARGTSMRQVLTPQDAVEAQLAQQNAKLLALFTGGGLAASLNRNHEQALRSAGAVGPGMQQTTTLTKTDSHNQQTIIQHLEINHPKPAPAEESLIRGLRKVGYVTRL